MLGMALEGKTPFLPGGAESPVQGGNGAGKAHCSRSSAFPPFNVLLVFDKRSVYFSLGGKIFVAKSIGLAPTVLLSTSTRRTPAETEFCPPKPRLVGKRAVPEATGIPGAIVPRKGTRRTPAETEFCPPGRRHKPAPYEDIYLS